MPIPATVEHVAVTGHGANKFTQEAREWTQEAITHTLTRLRDKHEATIVGTRLVLGSDSWAAFTALELGVPTCGFIPYVDRDAKMKPREAAVYRQLLKAAVAIQPALNGEAVDRIDQDYGWYQSNVDLVEWCDVLVVVSNRRTYGGAAQAIALAAANERPVILIDPLKRSVSVPTTEWVAEFATKVDLPFQVEPAAAVA